jgi:hypothetical protein
MNTLTKLSLTTRAGRRETIFARAFPPDGAANIGDENHIG